MTSRPSDELEPAADDSIPSGFLNTNFRDLIDTSDPALRSTPRYQIGESIGVGGIGQVFRVFDQFGGRSLALKTLQRQFIHDEAAVARFIREGLLTGTLQHPGIPPVYDHGKLDDGTPFFSMKLVEGQTLQQILKSRPGDGQDLGYLVGIFENVAQTLAYAHNQSVVHRDLKPQNIMVGRFGEVQVMDWGLAKQLGDNSAVIPKTSTVSPDVATSNAPASDTPASDTPASDTPASDTPASDTPAQSKMPTQSDATPHRNDLTTAGDIVGTPGYMAPEQARGEIDRVDTRVDVFALGSILYQILAGRPLFPNESRIEVIEKTRQGDLSEPLQYLDQHQEDRELVELCRQCLAGDAARRPADASQVAKATQAYIDGFERRTRQAEIRRSQSEVRIIESRKRQRWVIGLTTALTVVALVSAIVVGLQWRKASLAATAESVARDRAEAEAGVSKEINELLNRVLSASLPEHRGGDVTPREVIDDALPHIEGKFLDRPRVEGTIRRTLGESYRWLGEHDLSEEQFRRSLVAFEQLQPRDELEILETKDRLAGVLRSRGEDTDLIESEQLRREVLEGVQSLFGASHPRSIRAMNNLGTVLIERMELDEAKRLLQTALTELDAAGDQDQVARNGLLVNLADVDRAMGDIDSAESRYMQVIKDPETSTDFLESALVQLGEMLDFEGRHEQAVLHLRRLLEVRQEYHGVNNALTLSSLRKLCRAMSAAGHHEELIPLLQDSIQRHTEADWEAAGTVCEARSLLAVSLIDLGREEQAGRYLEETYELISRERGAKHKYAVQARKQLDAFRERQQPN